MKKKLYLTFDIETIVSGYSYNPSFNASVLLGGLYIAEELKKRGQKGTFYISLSPKAEHIEYREYLDCLNILINGLKSYDNIKIEPHIHAYNLPVSFNCDSDIFSDYNLEQQIELLLWAKEFFRERGIDVSSFRPGGYNNNDAYYRALKEAGFEYSTILLKNGEPDIDLIKKRINISEPYEHQTGVIEFPVTSLQIKSVKGKEERVNLSPDFFTIESIKDYLEKLDYINVNFHSFSMFMNRMTRENHQNQKRNNIKFFFMERLLNKVLHKGGIETINTNTIFRKEFSKWLDYFSDNNYDTYFIGEK